MCFCMIGLQLVSVMLKMRSLITPAQETGQGYRVSVCMNTASSSHLLTKLYYIHVLICGSAKLQDSVSRTGLAENSPS